MNTELFKVLNKNKWIVEFLANCHGILVRMKRILDLRYEPGLIFFKTFIKLTRIHVASFVTQAKNVVLLLTTASQHPRKTSRNYLWRNRSLLAIFQDKYLLFIRTELQNFFHFSVSKLFKVWGCLKDLKKNTAYMRPWNWWVFTCRILLLHIHSIHV